MSSVSTDLKKITWFLTHAVENVYPSREALCERLSSGKPLRVYHGIDPTGPTLHLGHSVPLRKLAELQELGHKIVLLIGDFTAMIGDPTDKTATRKKLTHEEVMTNCKLYKEQASAILKFDGSNAAEFRFNSEWLAKMSFADVVELASHFTVQQMMERDMFEKRYKGVAKCKKCGYENVLGLQRTGFSGDEALFVEVSNTRREDGLHKCYKCFSIGRFPADFEYIGPKPIHLHEFMYPLMQGYDSVAMDVDLEIGGNDQTFNMLAGRTLMRSMKGKDKFVVTNRLLVDSSGKKMGKSEGNMLSFLDSPEDMYGKVMSWTDEMIIPAWEIFTTMGQYLPDDSVALATGLSDHTKSRIVDDPYSWKRKLAYHIVCEMLGGDRVNGVKEKADRAAEAFTRVHSQGEKPEEVPELRLPQGLSLVDVLVKAELVDSKSEARRQVEQGGVKVDDVVVNDVKAVIEPTEAGVMIQKGKRFFVKVVKG